MGRLDDKVLLVIGGGSDGPPRDRERLPIGNGRAAALASAAEGAAVMVADLRADAAEATAEEIRAAGGRAGAVACDVADPEQCAAAVVAAAEAFGALHLLVNNVGIADAGGVTDTDADTFDRIMRVNVRGHLLTVRHALPEMAEAGGGAVVNMSSLNAYRTGGAGISYDTSKAALLGLSRHAAATAAPMNVRVNTVLPGVIDSTMLRRALAEIPAEHVPDLTGQIPMGRVGTPWEVARCVVFLLSDEASYVTGAELVVDGGLNIAML
ncbi:glucose 1-dehydrogenase [Actinomadura madurae]|uniref:SDR family NAD(P)-dependent oxidoreductase n=1 Tax=Actinomadura madurae TaxID=1993 RepID=UPI0020275A8D|nr:glucose 1-dehydrogenase [Actinomadura madurae]URN03105.1 glucose 1-dehydrogenase [Actinomadura madurae]